MNKKTDFLYEEDDSMIIDPQWQNILLNNQGHQVSLINVGQHVIIMRQAGKATFESFVNAYKYLDRYTQSYSAENRYVLIEDISQMEPIPKRCRNVPKNFHQKDHRKSGIIIFSNNIMLTAIVNALNLLYRPRIPIHTRRSLDTSIELALEILKNKEKQPTHAIDYSSDKIRQKIHTIANMIIEINWDQKSTFQNNFDDPELEEIKSSLSWLKRDFEENLEKREEAISQLQEAKDQFDILTDASFDSIFICDPSGRLTYSSKEAQRLIAKTKEHHYIYDLFADSDIEQFRNSFDSTLSFGLNSSLEVNANLAKGETTALELRLRRITSRDQDYIFIIARDISKEKKSKEIKEKMLQEVFHSAKLASIGELAAGVGHEINNPLSIIYGNLELLRTKIDDPSLLGYLDRQERSIDRISRIVKGLKSFARQDDSTVEVVDINKTIKNTLSFIQEIYKKDDISVTYEPCTEELPTFANNGRLQQVLINLLSNSKDALKGRTNAMIKIKAFRQDDLITITIEDNGHGIDDSTLPRIFNNFFTTKDVGKGTGLGLCIAKSIIEDYDGKISISSRKGHGTIVTLKLLHSDDLLDEIEEHQELEFKKLSGSALIVDDEKDIRDILTEQLLQLGITPDSAKCGYEALEKVQTNKYDFIFSDLKMPGMSGETFIAEMNKMNLFNGKIFIVTGMISPEASKLPVNGIVEKPFELLDIYNCLTKI